MAYKDILAHIDIYEGACRPLEAAVELAGRFGSHVIGLTVSSPPISAYSMPEIYPQVYEMLQEVADRSASAAKDLFLARLAKESLSSEFRAVEGDLLTQVATHGRYCDLIVVSQPDRDEAFQSFAHELPIVAGRPVLVVPRFTGIGPMGNKVLIAWNGEREAARAVADAMPLLVKADKVDILAISASAESVEEDTLSAADLAAHLARHGVKAEAREAVAADIDVGNLLLSSAADLGSDLLVMGAYGHSRFREIVLGGTTREILYSSPVPVLLSH